MLRGLFNLLCRPDHFILAQSLRDGANPVHRMYRALPILVGVLLRLQNTECSALYGDIRLRAFTSSRVPM